jgi:hypothetical protein
MIAACSMGESVMKVSMLGMQCIGELLTKEKDLHRVRVFVNCVFNVFEV